MTINERNKLRCDQPLHAVQLNDALLKLQTVQALSGLGKTNLYQRIKAGELASIKLGKRCTRFRASEVVRFLQALGHPEAV